MSAQIACYVFVLFVARTLGRLCEFECMANVKKLCIDCSEVVCKDGDPIYIKMEGMPKMYLNCTFGLRSEDIYQDALIGPNMLVLFPWKDKRRCTWNDLGNARTLSESVAFIYSHLNTECSVPICPLNHITHDALPCYSMRVEAPRMFSNAQMFRYCPAYTEDKVADNCEMLLPACPDHPRMLEQKLNQMPLVIFTSPSDFTLKCEILCPDGESNHFGYFIKMNEFNEPERQQCRRLYSGVSFNRVDAHWFVRDGFCTEEQSQRRAFLSTCNKRPPCVNGTAPEPYSEANPFASPLCFELKQNCRRAENWTFFCDQSTVSTLPLCSREKNIRREPSLYDDCERLPLCASDGSIPKDSFESSCTKPLVHCSAYEKDIFHCVGDTRETKPIMCELYAESPDNCEPLPLCLDTLRKTAYSECEFLCLTWSTEKCRPLPTIGQSDPFMVLERVKNIEPDETLRKFFADISRMSRTTITQQNFTALNLCSEKVSVTRPEHRIKQSICNPRPLCPKKNEKIPNPYGISGVKCVKLDKCTEMEMSRFFCSNEVPIAPFCDRYETDIAKIGVECIPRFMCEDFRAQRLKFRSYYSVLRYFDKNECEEICDDASRSGENEINKMIDLNRGHSGSITYKDYLSLLGKENVMRPSYNCRERPSIGHDPWNVSVNEPSRAVPWCSKEASLLFANTQGCNRLPLCDESGKVPANLALNPFYARSDQCVKPKKSCTVEEAAQSYCITIEATTTWDAQMYVIIAIASIVVFLFIVIVITSLFIRYKMKRIRQHRKRHPKKTKKTKTTKTKTSKTKTSKTGKTTNTTQTNEMFMG